MRRYLSTYSMLAKMNVSLLTMYRTNFVNSMLSSFAWAGFSILSIVILTMRTPQAFGWKREEIILLSGAYSVLIGIFHTLFSRNFERMARLVQYGQLDYVLSKPLDSQFAVSLWFVNYTSLIRIPLGFGIVWYVLVKLGIAVTPAAFAWSSLLLLVGLALLYSIWYTVATITIWFPRTSNVVDLMYSVSSIARFPGDMVRQLHWYVFLFLAPLTVIMNTPVRVLLHKGAWYEAVILVSLSLLFFLASRKFWFFALRHYTSASS